MLRVIQCFFILSLMFLQACQPIKDTETPVSKKTDLSRAASYNTQLGLEYLKQGDRPRAKSKLLTALKQKPKSPDVNAALAYYFEQTNELDQAKKYYDTAMKLSPTGAQLNNYGAFLCRQGEYKNAEIYFKKAVEDVQYLNTAAAYENAGLCSLAIPDDSKARLFFISALQHDPSRRESLYELIKLEMKLSQDNEAFNLLQKYSHLVLNDPVLLNAGKNIAIKAGKYEMALKYKNRLKKLEHNTVNSGVNNEHNSHNG
ncbi:MAG: type IV pilus biogenesis/stability protein PilW [Legionella sp.]|nr:type IV pilus biogenesis/stability protein PilW [Legionella sp.]